MMKPLILVTSLRFAAITDEHYIESVSLPL